MKQQFNVNLESDLVARIKHRSIDDQLSLSDLVGRVLTGYLEGATAMSEESRIVLQPMVHVREMSSTVALLEVLGGTVLRGSRDGDWVQVQVGGAEVGLLGHAPNPEQGDGEVELNFQVHGSLDDLEAKAREAGVEVATPVTDEGFGRQLQLRNKDGLLVKVNEIDPGLIG